MMDRKKAMYGTMLWGVAGAGGYLLGQALFPLVFHPLLFFIAAGWMVLVGYTFSLARWAQKPWLDSLFPLVLPVIALLLGSGPVVFFVLLTGVLAWLRSGFYFRQGVRGLGLEILLSGGGLVLLCALTPNPFLFGTRAASPLHNALGIWLFYLVQSVYFLLMAAGPGVSDDLGPRDRFEDARRRAEEILSS